jgi:hypothetical protein
VHSAIGERSYVRVRRNAGFRVSCRDAPGRSLEPQAVYPLDEGVDGWRRVHVVELSIGDGDEVEGAERDGAPRH